MSMANNLPAISVSRPYLATVLNLLIIVAGLAALFGVEVRELPDVDRPIVTVRANFPGGSPETIDAEITSLVEGAVARVNGVLEVRSSSEENNFRIRIVFRPSVDLVTAANDVREAVNRVARDLPDGVENLVVVKADADAQPIMRLAVSSKTLPIDQLSRTVENEIVPAFTSVNGVADVTLFGGQERVLRVVIDPMKLAAYKLAVSDVIEVLEQARFDIPAGSFKSIEQEVIIRADASVTRPEAVEALMIRDPVRLRDIGHVFFSPADAESAVRLNGRTVISLGIIRQAASNTVQISREVTRAVGQLNQRNKDLALEIISDDAIFIRGAIWEVLVSLAIAVVIVVAVIALFMRNLRLALIPAVAIPVALVGTIAAIWLLGFSLNLITLLALVLATGLVVDDAIVVLENIQRFADQGAKVRAAAVLGTRQVFFAVIATTATLVSVFTPISFLPSTAGRLFGEFGFVLAVAVCLSSFVALTLVPMLASRIGLPGGRPGAATHAPSQRRDDAGKQSIYTRILDLVLTAPLIVVGLGGFVIVGAAVSYQFLGEELVPEEDRGLIVVSMLGPDGVSLDYMDRQVEKAENILRPLVEEGTARTLYSITGRYDINRGYIEAPLLDWAERDKGEGEIARQLNRELARIPGARARVRRGNSLNLRDAGGGLRFALTGSNYESIASEADRFMRVLERQAPQIESLRVEFRATQPQISIDIDRRRATDLGVSIDTLATTLKSLVDTDEVGELVINDDRVPIIMQATKGAIDDPADLRNLFVPSSSGELVPLSQLVTLREYAVAAELDRHGQRRAVEMFADLTDGSTLRQAVDVIRELADRELPSGIGLLLLDEAAALDDTKSGVGLTYVMALVIVFLVLVAQFESVTSALVVLLTIPFGICAAIFALALTGITINIYSQIGILMLIGIMAKNAILMVEFADQLREQGKSVLAAAREASIVRLRPIMMTMVSTILAGLPLVLGGGPGIEACAAIGWVVFGGLGIASCFTLFMTPALYVLISGLAKPRNDEASRVAKELEEAHATFI
ncbi:MAG: efflux RND transporter permease subunit [Pseudomonadota bacterium]